MVVVYRPERETGLSPLTVKRMGYNMGKIAKKIFYIIDMINEWVGIATSSLITILALLVGFDIVVRTMGRPTQWGLELSCIILTFITFLGAGYCMLHGGHVKVDVLYNHWSERTKAIVDVLTYPFIIATCVVLFIYGGDVAWESLIGGRRSTSAWEPYLWISQIMVPLGAVLCGVQALVRWIRDLVTAVTGKNLLASVVVRGEGGLFQKKE